jgi:cytochrome c-type protein NapC
LIRRSWHTLTRPAVKYSVLSLLATGFLAGIIFWGGFHTGLEATSTLAFCTSCHDMRDTVFPEYEQTIHYSNRAGVRATCSDCHVPKEWGPKMVRKAQAALELWGEVTGVIDTKEKFEAKRMELATHEWQRMKASGSRECRNCHSWDAMNSQDQSPTAKKRHMIAQKDGKSCIDCHKGIAHHLPKEYHEPDDNE